MEIVKTIMMIMMNNHSMMKKLSKRICKKKSIRKMIKGKWNLKNKIRLGKVKLKMKHLKQKMIKMKKHNK